MRMSPVAGARVPVRGLGAWLARRSEGARLHAGVDLAAPRGTVVTTPEASEVVLVGAANRPRAEEPRYSSPPGWSGYGPRLVLLRGESGRYHLLAHLDDVTVEVGDRLSAGARVGTGSVTHHIHWEVRTEPRATGGRAVVEVTLDPGAWLEGRDVPWSGQCPERPGPTRDTPRACRSGPREERGDDPPTRPLRVPREG